MGYVLYHHGIQGQKWGRRNGPPYPLDREDYSAVEKRKNPLTGSLKLNSLSGGMARKEYLYKKETEKEQKLQSKRPTRRVQKKLDRVEQRKKKLKVEFNKEAAVVERLVDELSRSGLKVSETTANYRVDYGRKTVALLLGVATSSLVARQLPKNPSRLFTRFAVSNGTRNLAYHFIRDPNAVIRGRYFIVEYPNDDREK